MKWINDDFKNKHVLNVGTSSFYWRETHDTTDDNNTRSVLTGDKTASVPGISTANKYRCHTPTLYPELQLTIISVVD